MCTGACNSRTVPRHLQYGNDTAEPQNSRPEHKNVCNRNYFNLIEVASVSSPESLASYFNKIGFTMLQALTFSKRLMATFDQSPKDPMSATALDQGNRFKGCLHDACSTSKCTSTRNQETLVIIRKGFYIGTRGRPRSTGCA